MNALARPLALALLLRLLSGYPRTAGADATSVRREAGVGDEGVRGYEEEHGSHVHES